MIVTLHWFWLLLLIPTTVLWNVLGWGLLGSYVAELRGFDRLEGLRRGLWFGPIGLAIVAWGRRPEANNFDAVGTTAMRHAVADIVDAECQHCGAEKDVSVSVRWFTCWRCKQTSGVK